MILFTETDHQLVASVTADSRGRFEFIHVKPGRYRLVARYDGFCTGNIPIEVVKPHRRGEIVIYFRSRGIDYCSDGEIRSVGGTRPARPTRKP